MRLPDYDYANGAAGESLRATEAREAGKVTLTEWAKQLRQRSGVAVVTADVARYRREEWHHVGPRKRKVVFQDPITDEDWQSFVDGWGDWQIEETLSAALARIGRKEDPHA